MLKHARRATIALTTSAVFVTGLGAVSGAQAATPRQVAASDWVAGQLEGGLLHQDFGGTSFASYGPSLDVYFALDELGTKPKARRSILDAVEANVTGESGDFSYVGSGGDSYAGAIGKTLTAVQSAGMKPADYAGGNLMGRLRALVVNDRDRARFGRVVDDSEVDYAITPSQAWAVRAFAAAGHRFTGRTTRYLLKQQCDKGYFRESMTGRSCESAPRGESRPSLDTTALAVMALRDARRAGVRRLGDDIRQALRWLVRTQNRNGSFTSNRVPNANATGLAAWVLAGTRWDGAAQDAAVWLRKLQVREANSAGTPLAAEKGAIAYDRASFKEGKEEGITAATSIEWALATAQSAVALNP